MIPSSHAPSIQTSGSEWLVNSEAAIVIPDPCVELQNSKLLQYNEELCGWRNRERDRGTEWREAFFTGVNKKEGNKERKTISREIHLGRRKDIGRRKT
jgi:hypothetical protein